MFSILQGHSHTQPAILSEDVSLTYGELLEAVETCAEYLIVQGLVCGEVTGISLSDEINHLISALALICLGTPHVNLASHETPENKRALARKLGVGQLIAQSSEEWSAGLRLLRPPRSFKGIRRRRVSGAGTALASYEVPLSANVLYVNTSGSTHVPKTFGIPLGRLLLAADRQASDASKRRVLRTSSVEFDSSRHQRLAALIAGHTCVLAHRISLETLGNLCARAEVSEVHIGTYKLASLLRSRAGECTKLPQATRIFVGGSRVSGDLRRQVRDRLTKNLWVGYATSEIGGISIATPDEHEALPEGVGLPMPHVVVEIVNARGDVVPAGEIGQARIRKAVMPIEYAGEARASSHCRDGWFYPGDLLSRTDNGHLIFHGRADDTIILNGINIIPTAIEDVLENHSDVREAVAYAIKSPLHGEIPVAAVVLRDHVATMDPATDLLDYCRKMLGIRAPRKLIVMDEIPRNLAGKPLRHALAQI